MKQQVNFSKFAVIIALLQTSFICYAASSTYKPDQMVKQLIIDEVIKLREQPEVMGTLDQPAQRTVHREFFDTLDTLIDLIMKPLALAFGRETKEQVEKIYTALNPTSGRGNDLLELLLRHRVIAVLQGIAQHDISWNAWWKERLQYNDQVQKLGSEHIRKDIEKFLQYELEITKAEIAKFKKSIVLFWQIKLLEQEQERQIQNREGEGKESVATAEQSLQKIQEVLDRLHAQQNLREHLSGQRTAPDVMKHIVQGKYEESYNLLHMYRVPECGHPPFISNQGILFVRGHYNGDDEYYGYIKAFAPQKPLEQRIYKILFPYLVDLPNAYNAAADEFDLFNMRYGFDHGYLMYMLDDPNIEGKKVCKYRFFNIEQPALWKDFEKHKSSARGSDVENTRDIGDFLQHIPGNAVITETPVPHDDLPKQDIDQLLLSISPDYQATISKKTSNGAVILSRIGKADTLFMKHTGNKAKFFMSNLGTKIAVCYYSVYEKANIIDIYDNTKLRWSTHPMARQGTKKLELPRRDTIYNEIDYYENERHYTQCAISSDGKLLASVVLSKVGRRYASVWNIDTGKQICRIPFAHAQHVQFDERGQLLICLSIEKTDEEDDDDEDETEAETNDKAAASTNDDNSIKNAKLMIAVIDNQTLLPNNDLAMYNYIYSPEALRNLRSVEVSASYNCQWIALGEHTHIDKEGALSEPCLYNVQVINLTGLPLLESISHQMVTARKHKAVWRPNEEESALIRKLRETPGYVIPESWNKYIKMPVQHQK